MREAELTRTTNETDISVSLILEGTGQALITSDLYFLGHMLESFAKHGLFDLTMSIQGDLQVDAHHSVEDSGIVLGEAFRMALGDKRGINRAGYFVYPMDEALALCAVDLSGRPHLTLQGELTGPIVGDMPVDLVHDFFEGFANALAATIHLHIMYGRSDHHKIEALFKAFARAMRQACSLDSRAPHVVPSTKGVL